MSEIKEPINIQWFRYGLTDDDYDSLQKQGVDTDDFDYMLVIKDEYSDLTIDYGEINEWHIARLLTGCCENVWHRIVFRGEPCFVGIAYHG